VKGSVLTPGDAAYEAARPVYFTALERRPAAIVRAADAQDVARVVRLVRASGSDLAIRNGGHSLAGHGLGEGGIVLDVRELRTLDLDVRARTARAGAGLTAGEYTVAAGAHGLATGFGDAPSVGIAGITLAGGVGFLHRRYGMTIDNLVGAELVTADGEIVRVDADSDAELFWAIRGGGGNFGVVTRLDLRLSPVDVVLGGMLMVPATAQRLVDFLDAAANAPDELTTILVLAPVPPMPAIPYEQHGRWAITVLAVYAGDVAAGERAMAPFRAAATPLLDGVRPMRYPEMYEGDHPHPPAVAVHTRFIDALDVAAAKQLLERLQTGTAPMRMAQFRPLGGAVARVPADATAFAHRDRGFIANVGAVLDDPASAPEQGAWARSVAQELGGEPEGAYVAFLGRDGEARIREAYPGASWDRLSRVKARYDPTNLFRHNQNIAP
jgi:FAD/FMN-containing dehydrogenase